MRYDHPNFIVRREDRITNLLGLATTQMARFHYFQKVRIKAVHSLAITAGTNTVAGVDIYNGTTSVGTVLHGTDTAGSINTSGVIDTTIEANGFLELRGKATSATMRNSYTIEYEVLPDAVLTA